ncbi:MAG: hypothetical protein RMI93_04365 [Caldimicrobium sp.]|nr:hypothetical protein [Caldimicrobium sp.]MDW8182821.1 hypothetical protein [Caldimicrobium sp.]
MALRPQSKLSVSVEMLSSSSGRYIWSKFEAVAPFKLRGMQGELDGEGVGM